MVERTVTKLGLHDRKTEPLIPDRAEAEKVFEALLKQGESLYPSREASKEFPKVARVIPLRER